MRVATTSRATDDRKLMTDGNTDTRVEALRRTSHRPRNRAAVASERARVPGESSAALNGWRACGHGIFAAKPENRPLPPIVRRPRRRVSPPLAQSQDRQGGIRAGVLERVEAGYLSKAAGKMRRMSESSVHRALGRHHSATPRRFQREIVGRRLRCRCIPAARRTAHVAFWQSISMATIGHRTQPRTSKHVTPRTSLRRSNVRDPAPEDTFGSSSPRPFRPNSHVNLVRSS